MIRHESRGTDSWLTPPDLIAALGPFDVDPCCEPWMPWRTAARMIALTERPDHLLSGNSPQGCWADLIGDGLKEDWGDGLAFVNPPYSDVLPWAIKVAARGNAIALTSAKSPDTRWGQLFLKECSAVYFLAGRLLFHMPDGSKSAGKWLPNALWAFGPLAEIKLRTLEINAMDGGPYAGVLMGRK